MWRESIAPASQSVVGASPQRFVQELNETLRGQTGIVRLEEEFLGDFHKGNQIS
jgi:hypothetical protein